ncbi:MAG: hypothetical protein PHC64_02135 [Candidatus Gastranaerophilales bacterium]|nr:hypothetical protein [Candidatus Gastranaerophilales bacterium]
MNIQKSYDLYFNSDLRAIFEHCSKIARKNGYKLYLIGGIVRDLLLNQKSLDIDITVEGNAIEFVKILENKIGAKILSLHQNFGTAKVQIEGQKVDFASTRNETYPKLGHLPHIEKIGCSLKEDVLRRDFTINSIAMSLNFENFADIVDYTGGLEDLNAKKIRILHDKSFVDDPTRIIRALKYATRLGFELEEKTFKLQEEYLNNINYDMCYKRVKQEIRKTFEQNSQEAFEKFIGQKIYKLIASNNQIIRHAELVSASYQQCILDRSRNRFGMTPVIENLIEKYNPKHPWIVYFGIIVINEDINKLQPTKNEKSIIESAKCLLNSTFNNDFEIYKAFSAQKTETLLILAALGKEKEVCHYLDDLKEIKPAITGKDLIAMRFKPSKDFNKIFDYVLKEKLKKPELTKTDEIKLVNNYLSADSSILS